MAKIFSFASWNVEHFHGEDERVQRIVDTLDSREPDVFGLYEVLGSTVFDALTSTMPDHSFFITENPKSGMEILVGVNKEFQAFVTQREEFKSKVPTLRPGALATLTIDGTNYPILFLHVKSLQDPRAWGLRDDMSRHVRSLKYTLDELAPEGETTPFMVVGDLNTMGLDVAYADNDLAESEEIEVLRKRLNAVNMRPLERTHELTWWNGSDAYLPGSRLDHVFADKGMEFKTFGDGAEVEVVGWPQEDTKEEKLAWIESHSDHAMLYGEVHAP